MTRTFRLHILVSYLPHDGERLSNFLIAERMHPKMQELQQQALLAAEKLIDLALEEDLGTVGDITTLAISENKNSSDLSCRAVMIAKSEGVVAGIEIAGRVFLRTSPSLQFKALVKDGQRVEDRQIVARVEGPATTILSAERIALNFLQHLSGIATLTARFVQAASKTKAHILDTRKTTPGWRVLEKYAVACGGGESHRLGLHDMFLIKENHIATAGGIQPAVERCRAFSHRHKRNWLLEVEAKTFAEVQECLRAGVDRILLDNMSLEEIRQAVQTVAGRVPLEASGSVILQNVAEVAATGVGYISIGALTHSAPAMDFSMLLSNQNQVKSPPKEPRNSRKYAETQRAHK